MKNPKRLGGEKFNVINLILAIALVGSVVFVVYSSSKNKSKTAGLTSNNKEETTFDTPIDVSWEGEIMATFVSGQDYGIEKTLKDEKFPYFYAGINSDAFPRDVVLEGKVKITGKWTGITCAYQNTVFKRCVPEVEVQKIERTGPLEDWSESYAFSVGDFSGDKVPDVLQETFTGGAHCCWNYKAFVKNENEVKEIVFDEMSGSLSMKDVNGDGVYELIGTDTTFNYWKTSYADSPAPEIILSYDNNSRAFSLNLSLMKKPAPSQEEIKKKIEEAKQGYDKEENSESEGLSPLVWSYMLDLIYSGNEKTAWEFLDQVLTNSEKDKIEFRNEFQEQLEKSPYYEEIKK